MCDVKEVDLNILKFNKIHQHNEMYLLHKENLKTVQQKFKMLTILQKVGHVQYSEEVVEYVIKNYLPLGGKQGNSSRFRDRIHSLNGETNYLTKITISSIHQQMK